MVDNQPASPPIVEPEPEPEAAIAAVEPPPLDEPTPLLETTSLPPNGGAHSPSPTSIPISLPEELSDEASMSRDSAGVEAPFAGDDFTEAEEHSPWDKTDAETLTNLEKVGDESIPNIKTEDDDTSGVPGCRGRPSAVEFFWVSASPSPAPEAEHEAEPLVDYEEEVAIPSPERASSPLHPPMANSTVAASWFLEDMGSLLGLPGFDSQPDSYAEPSCAPISSPLLLESPFPWKLTPSFVPSSILLAADVKPSLQYALPC